MTETKDLEAYKKGHKAGAAAATRKTKEGKPRKRRRKVYRMKRPDVQLKQAIGKFQCKHPYISGTLTAAGMIGVVGGAAHGLGLNTRQPLQSIERIPVLGKIYDGFSRAANDTVRRYIR